MKIWLDDERVAPLGFVWLKTAGEVIDILATKADEVEYLSLDNDLGIEEPITFAVVWFGEARELEMEDSGLAVVWWMTYHNVWPAGDINIHSANGIASKAMADRIATGPYRAILDGRTFVREDNDEDTDL